MDVVTTPSAAPLLAGNPAIRRVMVYDKRGADRGPGGLWRMANRVRADGAGATAYLAQGSPRSALLARLAGYRTRTGFDSSGGRWLYTRVIRRRPEQHHAERLLRLAVGDDAAVDSTALTPALFPSQPDRASVDALLSTHGASTGRLIALSPGSVWATKRWPGFPALARSLSRLARIVVVGGPADHELAAAITTTTRDAIDATGRLSLLASAELIRRCALLVTNDSLPQHLASAMGTPTVTIFGPTIPGFGFGPLAPGSETVGHDAMPCRPCHPHGPPSCPLRHHRCMQDLGESSVLDRALRALHAA